MTLGRADFLGKWALDRTIIDRHGGLSGQFQGYAQLTAAQGEQVDYAETGQIRFGAAAPMAATRHYRWEFHGSLITVCFADGSPFHQFLAKGQASGTDHPCGADFYRVSYDFRDWPQWQAVWVVAGPRKDYTSTSTYRRHG